MATGTTLDGARLEGGELLALTSEMNEGGVVFGDGIEEDRLDLPFGARLEVVPSERRLRLVKGP